MLRELRIHHFALIEDVQVQFSSGESVITGETGSGKSVFVSALDFIRGAKSDQNVRRDEGDSTVEALFSLSPDLLSYQDLKQQCQDLDIPMEEDTLLIRRTLTSHGSKQRINDVSVTLQTLRSIMEPLLDIHAQNAQSLLRNPKTYLPLLDAFIGDEAMEDRKRLSALLKQRKKWLEERRSLSLSEEEAQRELDLLHYQKKEIEEAGLEWMDEDALVAEYKALNSATERLQMSNQLLASIDGDDPSLRSGVQQIAQSFEAFAQKDRDVRPMVDLIWQIDAELDTLRTQLRRYRDRIDINPERIHEIDQVFQGLQTLKRKYGHNKDQILAFLEEIKARLETLEHLEERRQAIDEELKKRGNEIRITADHLHGLRVDAAKRLEARVRDEMMQMAIRQMSFAIPFEKLDVVTSEGYDRIDFYISTNPGEPMRPLSEVASGGEMSRFMLALKMIASEITGMPTLVFDEIDTGISGRTAQIVAEKLQRLTAHHQVLVITHLPQIAAMADVHFRIWKESPNGRTYSRMEILDQEGRVNEQARLIGGVTITDLTRKSAVEMIDQAKATRRNREDAL